MIVLVSVLVVGLLGVAYDVGGPVLLVAAALAVCVFFDWRTRALRSRR